MGNTSPLLNLTVNAPTLASFNYGTAINPGAGSVNLAGVLTVNGPATFRAANDGSVVFVRTGVAVPGFTGTSGQDYSGSFLLQGTATFADLRSGAITFHQTVDGFAAGNPSDLTVGTGGTISFLGLVGSGTPLTSLTTSNLGIGTGQTVISGGGVTTTVDTGPANGTGAQTYNDAVVLGAGTTLTSLPARRRSAVTLFLLHDQQQRRGDSAGVDGQHQWPHGLRRRGGCGGRLGQCDD